ncbi:interferon-induced very large GTPase 1-like protein [Labeo rohita]|uniref:Interferon-induced very large GTPase 1-like protein n=1 Tax=Labeo rohita TaxID=84645 RepID=A0A498MC22_LABRO|nr:interferon-induced very large GTPase 1-like protein [Labeo rohita]
MFNSEAHPDQVQRERRMHKTVINVPHLLQPHLSDHQITVAVNECMHQSDPGPHVIILVLRNDQCSREDQKHVEKVLHSFSDTVYEYTMVLSTQEPDSKPTKVNDFIKEIIKKCSNRHYQLKNSSPVELREKIENFAQKNNRRYLVCDEFASLEGSENPVEQQVTEVGHAELPLTVALFGNSASVQFKPENILLGEEKPFKTIKTSRIVPAQRKIAERHVSVINMTSLHETNSVHHLINQLLNENEIHAFIFAVRLGQLTDADKMGLEWLQRVFGDEVLQFVMILFTYETEEECESIIDDMKNKIVLEELLEKCGGRYQTCNKMMNNQSEMRELMNNIEDLFKENQQQCYTADIYNAVLKRQNIFQKDKDEIDTEKFEGDQASKPLSKRKIAERHVSVINMIDLHEAELYLDSVNNVIDQLVNKHKIHAFIFVVRLGQLTDADKMGLEWLQRVFGDKVLQFVTILFTYETEEECDTIIDDLKSNSVLEQLLEKCGGRYQTCNKMMNNQSEMRDLMKKTEHLFIENKQHCYTGEMYNTEMRRKLQKSEKEIGNVCVCVCVCVCFYILFTLTIITSQ